MPSHEFLCYKCGDTDQGLRPSYILVFDKCRGKTCPDCGKVRKLGRVRLLHYFYDKPAEGRSLMGCMKCRKCTETFLDGICIDCFCEDRKKKGCICPFEKETEELRKPFFHYYCSLCEEFHTGNAFICKKCFEKENAFYNEQKREIFWRVASLIGGIVIGLFLGWLLLVKLRKKKTKN